MIVGTAGHVDHGKTSLVRAITGIDADRLPEEKARGITIDLGFAYRPIEGAETLGFVDVPGHERFVHNMLAGVAGIDYVLLVVAADDGPMPQTREHLQIVDLLGLCDGIVVLTKADLASAERLEALTRDMRALLAPTSLANAEIRAVSTVTGAGIGALEERLLAAARIMPTKRAGGRFRLAIDRSFSLTGVGTVVTGTVFAGHVSIGDRLLLSPSGREVRVRGLHAQNLASARGQAGQRCAVNIVGQHADKDHIRRGDWLIDAKLHRPTERIDARLRLLRSETRPLKHWTPVHLHLGATHVPARVALLDRGALAPGESGLAQIVLDRAIGALHGDRLIIRDQSAQRTIGGGLVIEPWPAARGRRKPQRLAMLAACEEVQPARAMARLLGMERGWINLDEFAQARNLTSEETEAARRTAGAAVLMESGQQFALSQMFLLNNRTAILETLKSHHTKNPGAAGLQQNALRRATDVRCPPIVFAGFVHALLQDKAIELDGPWVRLPGHTVRLTAADEQLWSRIQPLIHRERFQPPRVRDFADILAASEEDVRHLLRRLARIGKVVQVAHDHFFLHATVAEMAGIISRIADAGSNGGVSAATFRDRIGSGRKVAIQILEFFDRTGFTIRQGDLRSVRRDKRDMFGAIEK